MINKIRITIILLILNCLAFSAYSQKLELNSKAYFGIWNNETSGYHYGGAGLALLYEHPLKKGALRSGIEFRSIDWGNQVSLDIGYRIPYLSKDKWTLSGITSAGIGLALFRNNSLFVWSIDYMPEFILLKQKRIQLALGFGIRYTHNPAYKDYGSIDQVLDLPLKIGFRFNLKKKPTLSN